MILSLPSFNICLFTFWDASSLEEPGNIIYIYIYIYIYRERDEMMKLKSRQLECYIYI